MTNAALMVRLFLPASNVSLGLGLFSLILAACLAPLQQQMGWWPNAPWFVLYMGTSVLCLLGFSLGSRLKQIRLWETALLTPKLLSAAIVTAMLILSLFWLLNSTMWVVNDATAGLPLTASLALAALCMLIAAGVYRQTLSLLILAGHLLYFAPQLWIHILSGLRHPMAEAVAVTIILLALSALMWTYARAPERSTAASWLGLIPADSVLAQDVNPGNRVLRHSLASWLPIQRTTPARAFLNALEHSRLQAWVNDGSSFVTINGLALLVIWLARGSMPANVHLLIGVLTAVVAVITPLMNRNVLTQIQDLLWLSGHHDSRHSLVQAIFFSFLRGSLRLCGLGLLAMLLLSAVPLAPSPGVLAADGTLQRLGLTLLLLAPGIAAALLATALLMAWESFSVTTGNTLLFSLLLLAQMTLGGYAAVLISVTFSSPVAAALAVMLSITLMLGGAWLTAMRLAGLRELPG